MNLKLGEYPLNVSGAIGYYIGATIAPDVGPHHWTYLVNWEAPATKGQIERLVAMAKGCRSKARPAQWSMTRREAKNLIKLCKDTNDLRTLLDGWQTAEDWKNRVARTTNNKWQLGFMRAML